MFEPGRTTTVNYSVLNIITPMYKHWTNDGQDRKISAQIKKTDLWIAQMGVSMI